MDPITLGDHSLSDGLIYDVEIHGTQIGFYIPTLGAPFQPFGAAIDPLATTNDVVALVGQALHNGGVPGY